MSAFSLDSSAFLKLAVVEAESAAVRTYLAKPGARRLSSALLRTESLRAVRHLGAYLADALEAEGGVAQRPAR